MKLSTDTAFDVATDECIALIGESGAAPVAIAEAMLHTGLGLLVRERGAEQAAQYTMTLLHTALREEAARGY